MTWPLVLALWLAFNLTFGLAYCRYLGRCTVVAR